MPHEVTFRMSLYSIASPAGAMLSGALQGALSTNFEGLHGREGWRWAFIINVSLHSPHHVACYSGKGVCTIAIALAAFVILPGYVGSSQTT